ncbi:MAG: response regulator [Bacteroidia bacterium]
MLDQPHKPINILLADDDKDDRFFFDLVLKNLAIPTTLVTMEDGALLMDYLIKNTKGLPDVLFLDLNMPKKNGSECLLEIKQNEKLKNIPVIIYSTSYIEEIADQLYKDGAHYYIRKTNLDEIEKILQQVLSLIVKKKFERPPRNKFILNLKI